jgi:hypothetical protein
MAQMLEVEDLPIRLTARGVFLHGDTPLHPRVAALFARNIVPEPDGKFRIQLGHARHPLLVEDAAYSVSSLTLQGPQGDLQHVVLHLSDGAQEPLAAGTLMQSEDNVLYCRIRRHGLRVAVRLTAQQYHNLALSMQPHGDGFALRLGGALWPVGPYEPGPLVDVS